MRAVFANSALTWWLSSSKPRVERNQLHWRSQVVSENFQGIIPWISLHLLYLEIVPWTRARILCYVLIIFCNYTQSHVMFHYCNQDPGPLDDLHWQRQSHMRTATGQWRDAYDAVSRYQSLAEFLILSVWFSAAGTNLEKLHHTAVWQIPKLLDDKHRQPLGV